MQCSHDMQSMAWPPKSRRPAKGGQCQLLSGPSRGAESTSTWACMSMNTCLLLSRLSLGALHTRQALAAPRAARRLFSQAALQSTAMSSPQADSPSQQEAEPTVQFSAALTSIDTDKYEEQLEAKIKKIRAQFAEFNPPELEAFHSRPKHYRMRSEFRVWHDKEDMYYIMYEKDEKGGQRRVRVDQFPVASELVNQLMERVLGQARQSKVLSTKLKQVNFHTTLSGESMVTLIYHKKLDKKWEEEARGLQEVLAASPAATSTPNIIGRSKGQKVVLGKDEVQESLEVDGQQLKYIQVEYAFSQPNAGMSRNMLTWAKGVTAGSGGQDLLELYCGNGNFTVALAPNFRQVVATEVSKSGVAAAKRNFELNGVGNVFVARISSEEFTEAWKEGRPLRRLEGLDLKACDFQTLLVDPPRAGLDGQTVELLSEFENVVYISCNPDTLHANLLAVKDQFEIKRFALFDQFPYTHHIECGVYLERRQGVGTAAQAAAAPAAAAAAGQEGAAGAAAGEGGAAAAEAAGGAVAQVAGAQCEAEWGGDAAGAASEGGEEGSRQKKQKVQ